MSIKTMSTKSRRMLACGMFCLAVGLMLRELVPAPAKMLWIEGLYGFLIGLSIALNLGAVIVSARRPRLDAK